MDVWGEILPSLCIYVENKFPICCCVQISPNVQAVASGPKYCISFCYCFFFSPLEASVKPKRYQFVAAQHLQFHIDRLHQVVHKVTYTQVYTAGDAQSTVHNGFLHGSSTNKRTSRRKGVHVLERRRRGRFGTQGKGCTCSKGGGEAILGLA